MYQGMSYPNADGYTVRSTGGTVGMGCCATFPLLVILIWNPDCDNLQYDYLTAGPPQYAFLSHDLPPGAEAWLWVGPSMFNGIPCGSDYVMDVSGVEVLPPPVPAERVSGGGLKLLYRR